MIAADTSTWVAFLEGGKGEDTQLLDKALEDRQVLMVPAVLTELLSDPKLPSGVAGTLSEVPLIEIGPSYWQRAGVLRAKVLLRRRTSALSPKLRASILYLGLGRNPLGRNAPTYPALPRVEYSCLVQLSTRIVH